jgi:hypothetical protein
MMMSTLKELVAKGNEVNFIYYRDGNLWYEIDGTDFTFPVPIDDIGNATFHSKDKAMLFMRYIRKQLATLEEATEALSV